MFFSSPPSSCVVVVPSTKQGGGSFFFPRVDRNDRLAGLSNHIFLAIGKEGVGRWSSHLCETLVRKSLFAARAGPTARSVHGDGDGGSAR